MSQQGEKRSMSTSIIILEKYRVIRWVFCCRFSIILVFKTLLGSYFRISKKDHIQKESILSIIDFNLISCNKNKNIFFVYL